MSDEFDVERELSLSEKFHRDNLPLRIFDFPEGLECRPPGSHTSVYPGLFEGIGGFIPAIRIGDDYFLFMDHQRDDFQSAMKLAGYIALAAAIDPSKLNG